MFKDLTVYATPNYSSRQIPVNQPDSTAFIAQRNGSDTTITSEQLIHHSQSVWDSLQGSKADEHPVFMSADLESPFGFATFLACASNFKKVYIPGTYNLS